MGLGLTHLPGFDGSVESDWSDEGNLRQPMQNSSAKLDRSIWLHLLLVVLAVICLIPFFWLICASFKKQEDLFSSSFLPWHHLNALTLENIRTLFTRIPFPRWLFNSL